VFLGAYALIPYMALWSPKSPPEQLPPPKEELVSSCWVAAPGWVGFVSIGSVLAVQSCLFVSSSQVLAFGCAFKQQRCAGPPPPNLCPPPRPGRRAGAGST